MIKKIFSVILVVLIGVCCFPLLACNSEGQVKLDFTVTFNGGGGTLVSGEEVQTVKSASEIVPPVYEYEGKTQIGWDNVISNIKSSKTVTALWESDTIKVVFDLNGIYEGKNVKLTIGGKDSFFVDIGFGQNLGDKFPQVDAISYECDYYFSCWEYYLDDGSKTKVNKDTIINSENFPSMNDKTITLHAKLSRAWIGPY